MQCETVDAKQRCEICEKNIFEFRKKDAKLMRIRSCFASVSHRCKKKFLRDRRTLVPRLVFIAINVSIEWDRGERDAIKCYRAGLHGYKRSYTVGEGTRNSSERWR